MRSLLHAVVCVSVAGFIGASHTFAQKRRTVELPDQILESLTKEKTSILESNRDLAKEKQDLLDKVAKMEEKSAMPVWPCRAATSRGRRDLRASLEVFELSFFLSPFISV